MTNIALIFPVCIRGYIFVCGNNNRYSCKNCEHNPFHRFNLRDDYFTMKSAKSVESISKENTPEERFAVENIRKDDKNYCFHCYQQIKEFIAKPLHWTDFFISSRMVSNSTVANARSFNICLFQLKTSSKNKPSKS